MEDNEKKTLNKPREEIKKEKRDEALFITARLHNGMLVRVPFKNHKEILERMEKALHIRDQYRNRDN